VCECRVHFGTVFGSKLRGGGVPLFFSVIRLSSLFRGGPKGGPIFVPSGPYFRGCESV
jgi:hypothetical protein